VGRGWHESWERDALVLLTGRICRSARMPTPRAFNTARSLCFASVIQDVLSHYFRGADGSFAAHENSTLRKKYDGSSHARMTTEKENGCIPTIFCPGAEISSEENHSSPAKRPTIKVPSLERTVVAASSPSRKTAEVGVRIEYEGQTAVDAR